MNRKNIFKIFAKTNIKYIFALAVFAIILVAVSRLDRIFGSASYEFTQSAMCESYNKASEPDLGIDYHLHNDNVYTGEQTFEILQLTLKDIYEMWGLELSSFTLPRDLRVDMDEDTHQEQRTLIWETGHLLPFVLAESFDFIEGGFAYLTYRVDLGEIHMWLIVDTFKDLTNEHINEIRDFLAQNLIGTNPDLMGIYVRKL